MRRVFGTGKCGINRVLDSRICLQGGDYFFDVFIFEILAENGEVKLIDLPFCF